MALPFSRSAIPDVAHVIDDPPPILKEGTPNWRERHAKVLDYARTIFANQARDAVGDAWRNNCNKYAAFYRGSFRTGKRDEDLAKRQVNLLEMFMKIKHAKLLSDNLKVHYVSDKYYDYEFTVAMSRLFDWHERITRRRRLQQRIELTAPIFGTVGAMYLPRKKIMGQNEIVIPGYWEYLDPRTMYFEPRWDNDEELPYFAVRTISTGTIEDERYRDLLDKRGLDSFGRGPSHFSVYKGIAQMYSRQSATYNWLATMNQADVEVIRLWVKDERREKIDIYYPTFLDADKGELDPDTVTPEVQEAFSQADNELELILEYGSMPEEAEHHYAHYVRHMMQEAQYGEVLSSNPNWQAHLQQTLAYFKKQTPDDYDSVPMFKGGWRYIKIIGDQVVSDGSIDLEYDQFPVALFNNNINPESLIGMSDLENLMALQRDLNALMSYDIELTKKNAYPPLLVHPSMKDVELVKKGPMSMWTWTEDMDPAEIAQIKYLQLPQTSQKSRELMMILSEFMQMVSGANDVMQGQVPRTRTSGIGVAQLQQQASQRFTSTQYCLNDGWERSAAIWLAQMKQYWQDDVMIPPIGQEYTEPVMVHMDDIDPYAHLIVERVSRDVDLQAQAGQAAMQIGMLAMQGGMPFPMVLEMLSKQYDAGTVGRVASQLQQIFSSDQQEQMRQQMMRDQQLMANAGGQGGQQQQR